MIRFEAKPERGVGFRVFRVEGTRWTPLEHGPMDRETAAAAVAQLERKARRKPRTPRGETAARG